MIHMHTNHRGVVALANNCVKNKENIHQQCHSFRHVRLIPEAIMEPNGYIYDLWNGESSIIQEEVSQIEHTTDDASSIVIPKEKEASGGSKLTTSNNGHSEVMNENCSSEEECLVERTFSNYNSMQSRKKARITPSFTTTSSDEEYEISLLRSYDDSLSALQQGEKAILDLMKSQNLLPESFLSASLPQTIYAPKEAVASTVNTNTENLDKYHVKTPPPMFRNNNGLLPITLTARDVLLGRGIKCNSLPGNKLFRKLVDDKKELYFQQGKNREAKNAISHQVMQTVHAYGGRFLEMTSVNPLRYEEVDEARAKKKCSQRLRERRSKTDK